MGTLVCPLCCDEEFSNQLSLRYHLLSITDNVYCPECSERFDSIHQLADHLDGMCGKADLMNNDEECTPGSDMINVEERIEEEKMMIHEGEVPQTEDGSGLNNTENMRAVFNEKVMQQVIAVAADPQLDGSESVYLVSDVSVQETSVTGIENECADIREQKLGVTVDHENSSDSVEQSYASGNYEMLVGNAVTAHEDLPLKLYGLETSELVGVNGQECGEAVQNLSSAGEMISGSSESEIVSPDVEGPGDGQLGCAMYACSGCRITFSSIMEHIRMYHGGQEVVVEVPQAKKNALIKLIGASKEVLGANTEQVIDTDALPGSNDSSERALQEATDALNFVSDFSENHPENQAPLNCAAVNSESRENVKPYSWLKERARVVADEEKIKQILPSPKWIVSPVHTTEEHSTSELKCVDKEVKIGKLWETKPGEEMNSENATTGSIITVPALSLPGRFKKESRRLIFKRDTRTSIEKLFSGNFLLKGIGGRGTRPGPYLGVNRVPEVKVIMSPGDKGTENAISVFTCSTCQKEFGNVSAFERHSCTVVKTCTLVCKLCDVDISDMKAMRAHMESVHSIKTEIPCMAKRKYNKQMLPKPVKCESCDMTFMTTRSLKLHSKMHERSELKIPLECPVCHNTCSSNRTLKQHMKVHTKPIPVKRSEGDAGAEQDDVKVKTEKGGMLCLLVCKVCFKSFGNNEDLRAHWQEHLVKKKGEEEEEGKEENQVEQVDVVLKEITVPEEEGVLNKKNTVPCVQCHKEIDESCKEEHMAKHFSLLRYDCPICKKSFSKHGHLNMHMCIHRGVKEYSCIHCDKIFANMNLLRTHVQSHMVQRPYQCGFCGRGFFRPHDKVVHERVHTGEKPYSCPVCGMRFRVRYCLSLHMRRHTGVRPYSCNMCGKTFRTGTGFKAHTKIHLDERAYKCPFCPKKFNTLIQLSGHKNSHTKPYSCMLCNRPFSSLYAVRKHMSSHEEGSSSKVPLNFQCHVCGASYARRFAFRDHLKIHGHSIPPATSNKTCSNDSSSDML